MNRAILATQKYFPRRFFDDAHTSFREIIASNNLLFSSKHLTAGVVAAFLACMSNDAISCEIDLRESPTLFQQEEDVIRNFFNVVVRTKNPRLSEILKSPIPNPVIPSQFWVRACF